jgi:hypothetical protein
MTTKIVHWAQIAYLVVAWLFVVAVISQIFLAGLSLFASAANWKMHQEFGYGIGFLALLLMVLAFPGRIPRAIGRWLALLLVVYAIQTVLPNLRRAVGRRAAFAQCAGRLLDRVDTRAPGTRGIRPAATRQQHGAGGAKTPGQSLIFAA